MDNENHESKTVSVDELRKILDTEFPNPKKRYDIIGTMLGILLDAVFIVLWSIGYEWAGKVLIGMQCFWVACITLILKHRGIIK